MKYRIKKFKNGFIEDYTIQVRILFFWYSLRVGYSGTFFTEKDALDYMEKLQVKPTIKYIYLTQ